MTVVQIRVCISILILTIAIEVYGFRNSDTQMSVNGPNEDPPKGLKITSCGNNNLGKVLSVYLTECNASPCIFKRNNNYNYFLEFSPNQDHASLDANFGASALGIKTPLDALSGDICDKLLDDKKCPLKKGENYLLQVPVDVNKAMPPLIGTLLSSANAELKINLELKDPVKENKLCIVLAAKVK